DPGRQVRRVDEVVDEVGDGRGVRDGEGVAHIPGAVGVRGGGAGILGEGRRRGDERVDDRALDLLAEGERDLVAADEAERAVLAGTVDDRADPVARGELGRLRLE